jgi:hypothetical protein
MSKGTTRARLWLFGGLLLGGIVGCGADEQTEIIKLTNERLKEVTTKLRETKDLVKKAVDESIKSNQRILGTDKNLNDALVLVQDRESGLRRLGERLQRIKEFSERAKEKTSPEYSKELLAKYRNGLQENLVELEKEEKALNEVLKQAEDQAEVSSDPLKNGKGKVDDLKKELKNGRDAFELLTKQR